MTSSNCNLPNLIIAGVHKAGTTSLYSYLAKHPQICPSFKKEINFFVPLMFNRKVSAMETYGAYFNHCRTEPFRMEASPSYFYGSDSVAEAIKGTLSDVKIIVILREPTDRLISYFSRAISKSVLPSDISFNNYLTISEKQVNSGEHDVYSRGIREGIYIDYIRPWQRVFGENLKVVFFDDLKKSALNMTTEICCWLGLDTTCYELQQFAVENKTMQYRFRSLHRYVKDLYMENEEFWRRHNWLKQRLRKFYSTFNVDTGRKLDTGDHAAIARLRAIYAPHNKELKVFLESHNYSSLPGWLN